MNGEFRSGRVASIRILMFAGFLGATSANAENWRITPSISVTETLTDNVRLAPDDRKESDLITQISPGISINGTGARVKLNLNYRMNGILYANESSSNNIQNYLSASSTVEAVKNWLFVDANASITQQALSAFGSQPTSTGDSNINNNRAETRTYQLSPYVKGRIGLTGNYQVRYRWTESSTRSGPFGTVSFEEWTGLVNGSTGLASLRWSLDGSSQHTKQEPNRDIDSARLRGSLIYAYDPQMRFHVTAGHETNNYSGAESKGYGTYGGGFDWTPSNRTTVSASIEKRPFGNSHVISATHRTPRTSWRYSDRKDVTTLPQQLATQPLGTAYDLLFNALTTAIPDPVLRAEAVNEQLRLSGIPPDLLLARTFYTTRVFEQHVREASVAFLGVRNTVTLGYVMTDGDSIVTAIGAPDDLTLTSNVQQRGMTASWAHKLSPHSSLTAIASRYHSSSSSSPLKTTQDTVRVLLTHQLGRRTSGNLAVRYVRFDGPDAISDYSEKAITASLVVTF